MLAVVKKPRTRRPSLTIRGSIPRWMVTRLKKEYGKNVEFRDEEVDEALVDIFSTSWQKKIEKKSHPGENMRIYRENLGLTQEELGKQLGNVPRQNISAMEKGRRGISKEIAKALSHIFRVPADRFI